MRVRLVPLEGGTPIEIAKDLILVGRKEECDLRLDHKSISKLHCVIVKTDGLLLLRDLGSTNGTRVNGQRVRRAALLPKDQLQIASLKYTVEVTAHLPNGQDITKLANGKVALVSNVSSAFGGATSLTVGQMLYYAASQSTSSGTTWYGNVKSTQELTKDAFDAINNQVAFAP